MRIDGLPGSDRGEVSCSRYSSDAHEKRDIRGGISRRDNDGNMDRMKVIGRYGLVGLTIPGLVGPLGNRGYQNKEQKEKQ